MIKPGCLLAILCLCPVLAQADIYKMVDANGHYTYSSFPIKGGKKLEIEPLPTNDESIHSSQDNPADKEVQVMHLPGTEKPEKEKPGARPASRTARKKVASSLPAPTREPK